MIIRVNKQNMTLSFGRSEAASEQKKKLFMIPRDLCSALMSGKTFAKQTCAAIRICINLINFIHWNSLLCSASITFSVCHHIRIIPRETSRHVMFLNSWRCHPLARIFLNEKLLSLSMMFFGDGDKPERNKLFPTQQNFEFIQKLYANWSDYRSNIHESAKRFINFPESTFKMQNPPRMWRKPEIYALCQMEKYCRGVSKPFNRKMIV